jgi:hypothetical protein
MIATALRLLKALVAASVWSRKKIVNPTARTASGTNSQRRNRPQKVVTLVRMPDSPDVPPDRYSRSSAALSRKTG